MDSWDYSGKPQPKTYPDDFEGILNKVEIYSCPSKGVRVIISNGIPNHDVGRGNKVIPCEVNWAVEIPLNPVLGDRKEVPIRGMLAMALNGVPAYGPQEADGANAVEVMAGMGVQDAQFWYGHAGPNSAWHVHNPQMGMESESATTLLGYAMDGFPIYGHLDDPKDLDPNGGLNKLVAATKAQPKNGPRP